MRFEVLNFFGRMTKVLLCIIPNKYQQTNNPFKFIAVRQIMYYVVLFDLDDRFFFCSEIYLKRPLTCADKFKKKKRIVTTLRRNNTFNPLYKIQLITRLLWHFYGRGRR